MRRTLTRLIFVMTVVAVCVGWGAIPVQAQPVIAAYQKIYAMNFEVWHPQGLPAGWYVTFDGYPVAQVAPNHWVYGRLERGALVPTPVAVGAVVPMELPDLARVAVPLESSGVVDSRAFRSIAFSGLDNMGVLDDPLAPIPVAWKTGSSELVVWLGDRWYRVVPAPGQRTSRALEAKHPFMLRTLRERDAVWTRSDTDILGDTSRQWGFVWHGMIPFASFTVNVPADGSTRDFSLGQASGGSWQGGGNPPGGNWDTGGGEGSSGGGGGGGGWDTGGGGGSGGGGGGGWDSGGGGSGGGKPGSGNDGGGWDK